MAGPRRHVPQPSPAPLGGIVIDGSNVIASGLARAVDRLQLAVRWFRDWRPDLATAVFLDDSTFLHCSEAVAMELRQLCETNPDDVRFVRCPLRSPADVHVLEHAAERRALIVSNDRFWDHEQLRLGAITVQFVLRGTEFRPYEEATWFRTTGGALRLTMDELQRRVQA